LTRQFRHAIIETSPVFALILYFYSVRKEFFMSFEFVLRVIFMVILAVVGGGWGYQISQIAPSDPEVVILNTVVLSVVGALVGLILTPYITTRPARWLRALLGRLAAETLFAGLTDGCRAAYSGSAGLPAFHASSPLWKNFAIPGCPDLRIPGRINLRDAPG
jgi:hypothetical protein